MRRVLLILICLLLASLPQAMATEATVFTRYDLALGVHALGLQPGITYHACDETGDLLFDGDRLGQRPCPPVRDEDTVTDEGQGFRIGLFSLASPHGDVHDEVTLSLNDDSFDAVFAMACVALDGQTVDPGSAGTSCAETAAGCSALSMSAPAGHLIGGSQAERGNAVWAWTFTAHLNEATLETCLGSQGEATAVYS